MAGVLWHQGEGDWAIWDQYAGLLDGLIGWWRSELGVPDLPVVIGQMVPERPETPGQEIDHIHKQTPLRVLRTAFAPTPTGQVNFEDLAHISTRGHQLLGPIMCDALARARVNTGDSTPVGPENVRAHWADGTVTVVWDAAWCRVTDYRVEWWDGTEWSVSGVAHELTLATYATIATPSPAQVRVTTVNALGESYPVYANLQGAPL